MRACLHAFVRSSGRFLLFFLDNNKTNSKSKLQVSSSTTIFGFLPKIFICQQNEDKDKENVFARRTSRRALSAAAAVETPNKSTLSSTQCKKSRSWPSSSLSRVDSPNDACLPQLITNTNDSRQLERQLTKDSGVQSADSTTSPDALQSTPDDSLPSTPPPPSTTTTTTTTKRANQPVAMDAANKRRLFKGSTLSSESRSCFPTKYILVYLF